MNSLKLNLLALSLIPVLLKIGSTLLSMAELYG